MPDTKHPWFKMFASEFLTDPDVDNTPDSAMLLTIKIWCVCCIEGSCPADPEEIARKTRVPLHRVTHSMPYCQVFFDHRGGRLFSKRMEKEKVKSELARKNAEKRYGRKAPADGIADGTASGSDAEQLTPRQRAAEQHLESLLRGLDENGDDAANRSAKSTSARSPADGSADGSAVRSPKKVRKQEGKRARSSEGQKARARVDLVSSEVLTTVGSAVETSENAARTALQPAETAESVPVGTLVENSKKKAESEFKLPSRSELERRRQDQLQRLCEWKKQNRGNSNSNPNTEFKLA